MKGDFPADSDHVLGRWTGDVCDLLGHAGYRLALKQPTVLREVLMDALPSTGYVTLSLAYFPVSVNVDLVILFNSVK
jgi:hypothetical protein